jgi:hypothetical protein
MIDKYTHRLNMELDLQILFGLHVHSCTHWMRPRNSPSPQFRLIYEGAIGQPRYSTSICDPLAPGHGHRAPTEFVRHSLIGGAHYWHKGATSHIIGMFWQYCLPAYPIGQWGGRGFLLVKMISTCLRCA